jgi:hypothetical protein
MRRGGCLDRWSSGTAHSLQDARRRFDGSEDAGRPPALRSGSARFRPSPGGARPRPQLAHRRSSWPLRAVRRQRLHPELLEPRSRHREAPDGLPTRTRLRLRRIGTSVRGKCRSRPSPRSSSAKWSSTPGSTWAGRSRLRSLRTAVVTARRRSARTTPNGLVNRRRATVRSGYVLLARHDLAGARPFVATKMRRGAACH